MRSRAAWLMAGPVQAETRPKKKRARARARVFLVKRCMLMERCLLGGYGALCVQVTGRECRWILDNALVEPAFIVFSRVPAIAPSSWLLRTDWQWRSHGSNRTRG